MMSNNSSINLIAEAAANGELVLFLGAGASLGPGSEFPSGYELGQIIAKKFGIRSKGDDSLGQISELAELKFGRVPLTNEVRRVFDHSASNTNTHRLMSYLPCEYIITTNYDACIENNLNARAKDYDVILDGKDLITRSSDRTKILKIHGCINDSQDRFIITERDYYERFLSSQNFFIEAIKVLLLKNTCLFVGFSMQDVNFRQLFFDLKTRLGIEGVKGRFFSIQRSATKSSEKIWQERGIVTIRGDHTDIVQRLLSKIDNLSFTVKKNRILTTNRTILGRLPLKDLRHFEQRNGEHEQRFVLLPKRILDRSGLKNGDWLRINKIHEVDKIVAKCRVFESPYEDSVVYAPLVVRNMLRVNKFIWRRSKDYTLNMSKYIPINSRASINITDESEIFQLPLDFLKIHSDGDHICTLRALEFRELGLSDKDFVSFSAAGQLFRVRCMRMSSNPGRAGVGFTSKLYEYALAALRAGETLEFSRG